LFLIRDMDNSPLKLAAPPADLLVVSWYPVRPDQSSGDRRLAEVMRMFDRLGARVHCAVDHPADDGPMSEEVARAGFSTPVNRLGTLWRPCQEVLASQRFQLAFIEFWHVAEHWMAAIRKSQPWLPVVVDSVDVHFIREEGAAKVGAFDAATAAANKKRELEVYRNADAIVVVTEEDRDALVAEGIQTPIFVIPNVVPSRERLSRQRDRSLLFVGGFAHAPNVDGILWFVENCWERVRSAVQEARLVIVGSNPPESVRKLAELPGIEVTGYVKDTGPYLDAAAVSIAPLRYGGGMKGKVCEAMAGGLAVVSTEAGIQGIPATDRRDVLVGADPQGFADAAAWALAHSAEAEAIGRRSQSLIMGICGRDRVIQSVRDLLSAFPSHQPSSIQVLRWSTWATAYRTGKRVKRAMSAT
jgi:O-antigen biosynthesis protein